MDSTDSHSLKIVVYKPGERSSLTLRRIITETSGAKVVTATQLTVFPLMNAKLRFQNAIQCSTICAMITHQSEKIRTAKQIKLKR